MYQFGFYVQMQFHILAMPNLLKKFFQLRDGKLATNVIVEKANVHFPLR